MIFAGLAKVGMGLTEYEHHFVTAQPVNLHWIQNPEPAGDVGDRFQQDIEPTGKYVLHDFDDRVRHPLHSAWERGETLLECPLVIPFNIKHNSHHYDLYSWKKQLTESLDGAIKLELTIMLVQRGFDAVVTVGLSDRGIPYETREIVLFHDVVARM